MTKEYTHKAKKNALGSFGNVGKQLTICGTTPYEEFLNGRELFTTTRWNSVDCPKCLKLKKQL